MEWVATHLGHTMNVERTYYRVMSSTIEKAKIAKLLLLAEKGKVDQFVGKKLDEIDFDGNYQISHFTSTLLYILTSCDAI
jgi:hypothetical protein